MALNSLTFAASSHVQTASYDEETRELVVEFRGGAIYRYHDVPGGIVADLQQALSSGQFFLQNIRNAGYRYERIS